MQEKRIKRAVGATGRKRVKKTGAGILAALMITAMAVGLMTQGDAYAVSKVSDGDTTTTYTSSLGNNVSTQYAGRVWTDKTVYGGDATFTGSAGSETIENDSDFLVAYSALATSQSISGQIQVPVDVVFVIDNSNSMDDSVGGTSNQTRLQATVSAVNISIAKIMEANQNSRTAVVVYGLEASTLMSLGHYKADDNGNYITLTQNGSNTNFTSVSNESVQMSSNQRGTNTHIGIDAGMNILLEAADIESTTDSGSVVKHVPALILLSDGAATASGSGDWWNPSGQTGQGTSTANSYSLKAAMNAAYMKQQVNKHYGVTADSDYGAKVYTIGIGIEQLYSSGWGADNTDYYRAQMALDPAAHMDDNNTVAQAIKTQWTNYQAGRRARLDNYTFEHPDTDDISSIAYNDGYYSAESSDDVANVFDDITRSILTDAPMAPTEISNSDPLHDGYITYTDPIGEYMEVKEIKSIIYGEERFDQCTRGTDSDGNITYAFSGEIDSPVYGKQDIEAILITLKEVDGKQTLEIKIPAAAIPLRVNTIQLDSNGNVESNTSNNAYPIHILYTVGLKEGVTDADGVVTSQVSEDYISSHSNADGTINFYSNLYTGENTANGKTAGNATVEFKPASTNPYYFIQENTPLYLDEACSVKADLDEFDKNRTYYFQNQYYEGTEIKTVTVARLGSAFSDAAVIKDNGQWNIKAGRPRLGNLSDFAGVKESSATNTAQQYYAPTFVYADGSTDPSDGHFVVYLGNNGVLQADATGSLEISKTVTADEGLTPPNKTFTFTVDLTEGTNRVEGTYDYVVVDDDGHAVKGEDGEDLTGTIQSGGTIKLKDGQTAVIKNLLPGTEYRVTEVSADGFQIKEKNGDTGTIAGGEVLSASFTNNYSVTPVNLSTELTLDVEKVFNRWRSGTEFNFEISSTTSGDPLPDKATIEVTNDSPADDQDSDIRKASFGDITFTKPGTYTYTIIEKTPSDGDKILGVTYSDAAYNVQIIVEDNGEGALTITSAKMYKTSEDNGNVIPDEQITETDRARFVNTYASDSATISLLASKVYTDHSGQKDLANGMFTFRMETVDKDAPMPDQSGVSQDGSSRYYETSNVGASISFGSITFGTEEQGKTFEYILSEVIPDGAADNKDGTYILNGMTYDASKYTATVTVEEDISTGVAITKTTVVYKKVDGDVTTRPTFTNSYTPEPATLSEDTGTAIEGTKTLYGRDMKEGERFEFTLEAADDGTKTAIETDKSIIISENGDSTEVTGGMDGIAQSFHFGDVTFKKPGVYTFNVRETQGNEQGVTYDNHTCTVTVNVTDKNGQLQAEVTYNNGPEAEDHTNAVFENTYEAVFDTSTAVTISGTKTLTGQSLEASEFFFTVEPQEGAPMGESAFVNGNMEGTESTDGSYTGDITLLKNVTYTETGTYTYLIREQIPNIKRTGMTYDESVYKVTVMVTDDLNGRLAASSQIEVSADGGTHFSGANAVTFTNSYAPLSTTITPLEVTKILSGERKDDLAADEFEFEMSVASADPVDGIQLPENTVVGNDASGSVQFDDITFTKAGIYVVQVQEKIPDEADKAPGLTYDSHTISSTFTVRDRDGQLVVTRTGTAGSQTFINAYNATGTLSGNTYLKVEKTLSGRDFKDSDTFTFTLTAANDETKAALESKSVILNDEAEISIVGTNTDKKNTFGDIQIYKPGTYVFEITEQEGTIKGIVYDQEVYIVTVTATDNGDGTLNISSEMTKGDGTKVADHTATFTNIYEADSVTLEGSTNLSFTKTVAGRDWADDETFTFEIKADDINPNAPMPEVTKVTVSQPESGNTESFSFGNITYGMSDMTDAQIDANGTRTKEFIYNVTEETGQAGGLNYDSHTAIVTVRVTDNGTGQLSVSASISGNTFTNYYTSNITYSAAGGLNLSKTLYGHGMADGQFEFVITAKDEDSAKKAGITGTGMVVASGAALDGEPSVKPLFSDMSFNQEDAGKTYEYTITEKHDHIPDGYTYDTGSRNVKIDILDDGAGNMTVKTTVYGGTEGTKTYTGTAKEPQTAVVTFVNSYEATGALGKNGDAKIEATKTLVGRSLNEGEFKFVVKDKGNNQVSEGTNHSSGSIEFGEIIYTTKILEEAVDKGTAVMTYVDGKETYTFQYTVSEVTDGLADHGVTASDASFVITVTVSDNNDGTLTTAVTYPDGNSSLEFKNTYGTNEVSLNIKGMKQLKLSDELLSLSQSDIAGKYSFTITGVDENGSEAPLPHNTTVSNDATGSVDFGTIIYRLEDIWNTVSNDEPATDGDVADDTGTDGTSARTMTYTYTVRESGTVAGVTNDSEKTFQVTVTDDGKGNLTAVMTSGTDMAFTFTNVYSVEPVNSSVTDSFEMTKTLDGRDMRAGEFIFELKSVNNDVVATGENDESGKVTMDAVNFIRPGIYSYTLSEKKSGTTEQGVTYDSTVYHVSAIVTDKKDGTLSVEWTLDGADKINFANTYKAEGTSVSLAAIKTLTGRNMEDGEFLFELRNSDGSVLQTVKNDVQGGVRFDTIDFDEEGTYLYTINEVKGDGENVTYDDTVYQVTVTVEDNFEGYLTATVDYGGKNPVFANTYKAPEKVQPTDDTEKKTSQTEKTSKADTPKMDDQTLIIPAVTAMVAAIIVIAVVAICSVKRKKTGRKQE